MYFSRMVFTETLIQGLGFRGTPHNPPTVPFSRDSHILLRAMNCFSCRGGSAKVLKLAYQFGCVLGGLEGSTYPRLREKILYDP